MAVTSFERIPLREVGLNWYTLLVLVRTRLWSSFSSTLRMMGCRASRGRVSMMPTIVSAGPTMTLSSSGSGRGLSGGLVGVWQGQLERRVLGSRFWCLGTGGALSRGTWLALLERFSELRLRFRLEDTWLDRLHRLEAELIWFWFWLRDTCNCPDGVCCVRGVAVTLWRLASLPVEVRIPGEDFRGGKGGGVVVFCRIK